MAGIVGYGAYIPKFRIKLEEIASVWKKDEEEILAGLKVREKSVPAIDEDAITIGVEAGARAFEMSKVSPKDIGCVYFGSESHPYAVNPSSSIAASYLEIGPNYFAADLEFACKAATAGMQVANSLINSGEVKYGMTIGADTAQGKPHDALEYTAASAGAAYILGNKKTEIIADILVTSSYTSDTPDFWRRDGMRYPSHFGRFTGEPAYFMHVISEARKLMDESGLKPEDFKYAVFHMPNGKFPRVVSKKLGFTPEQIAPSLIVDRIGNPYSASSLTGLAAVLDIAKPNEKIFFVSYGSGAGSDGFIFQTTKNITMHQNRIFKVEDQIKDKVYISYPQYLKNMHTL